jgi:amidase
MVVRVPSADQLLAIAADIGLDLASEDATIYARMMAPSIAAYNVIDGVPDDIPPVKYPRESGCRPSADENPHNAWYYKTSIKGAARGKLKGKTVALKDNVMLAGVPMMVGTTTLEGYVPEVDATIVTRILDSGGEILGKAHCESLCLSGGSHTNPMGPVHNPHRQGYSAGGSSSGSAALVAAGEVDMAIGGDQGGSIRVPAAHCGIFGMKPTHGLVPYTGIMPVDPVIDHVGPMTATVHDNALLLEAIAGPDGYDPRQSDVKPRAYTKLLDGGVANLRIGVVEEGFGCDSSESDVDECVREAAIRFGTLGATIEDVSIPMHRLGVAIWAPISIDGATHTMMWGDAYGSGRSDLYVTSLMDRHRAWRQKVNELTDVAKWFLLLGTYISRGHGLRYYGKAMNISRRLTAAYDDALASYDFLLMPTVPNKPTPIPAAGASLEEYLEHINHTADNTSPTNITHHPAISVPCGMRDGLPIGMMLIGCHYDEAMLYRAARAFEQSGDWTSM